MKKLLIATMLVTATSFAAMAQTSTTSPMPAPNTEADKNAPLPGANSFTEGQAKDRIVEGGYADVTELKLDDKGVWQAKATKDGKPVMVSMDYQGNIVAK